MKQHFRLFLPLVTLLILITSCGQSTSTSTPEKVGLSSDSLALASQKMQGILTMVNWPESQPW